MSSPAIPRRSRLLAMRNAVTDPRWKSVRAIKLREQPICQLRIRCCGAAASEVIPATSALPSGSWLDPENLRSTCSACLQWQAGSGLLRPHF